MARQKAKASLVEQMDMKPQNAPANGSAKPTSLISKKSEYWVEKVASAGMDISKLMSRLLVETRKNETLEKCSYESLIQCAMEAASLGLTFGGKQGLAYPVPFYDSKARCYKAQLIVGYKGYITLAYRDQEIVIRAGVVYDNDTFTANRGTGKVDHYEPMTDRGEVVGAWAQAEYPDGRTVCEPMSMEEILKVRDGSQGYRRAADKGYSHPWVTHLHGMAQKTAIRALFKLLPQSTGLEALVLADETVHNGDEGKFHPEMDVIEAKAESVG